MDQLLKRNKLNSDHFFLCFFVLLFCLFNILGCDGSNTSGSESGEPSGSESEDECYYEEIESNVTSTLFSHGPLKNVEFLAHYYDGKFQPVIGGSSQEGTCDPPGYADGFYMEFRFTSDDLDSNGFPMESIYDNLEVFYIFGPYSENDYATIEFIDTVPKALGDTVKITIDATFLKTNTYLESLVVVPPWAEE